VEILCCQILLWSISVRKLEEKWKNLGEAEEGKPDGKRPYVKIQIN
jgi:hypothetical protein